MGRFERGLNKIFRMKIVVIEIKNLISEWFIE